MSAIGGQAPYLIHALPGRARMHIPGLSSDDRRAIESRLQRAPGVRSVQVNPLTGNALVHFDPTITDAPAILAALRALPCGDTGPRESAPAYAKRPTSRPASRSRIDGQGGRGNASVRRPLLVESDRSPGEIVGLFGGMGGLIDVLDVCVCVVDLALCGSLFGFIGSAAQLLRLCGELLVRRAARRQYEQWLAQQGGEPRMVYILPSPGRRALPAQAPHAMMVEAALP